MGRTVCSSFRQDKCVSHQFSLVLPMLMISTFICTEPEGCKWMVVGLAHVKNLPHRLFDNWLYNTTVKQAFIELSFIPPNQCCSCSLDWSRTSLQATNLVKNLQLYLIPIFDYRLPYKTKKESAQALIMASSF